MSVLPSMHTQITASLRGCCAVAAAAAPAAAGKTAWLQAQGPNQAHFREARGRLHARLKSAVTRTFHASGTIMKRQQLSTWVAGCALLVLSQAQPHGGRSRTSNEVDLEVACRTCCAAATYPALSPVLCDGNRRRDGLLLQASMQRTRRATGTHLAQDPFPDDLVDVLNNIDCFNGCYFEEDSMTCLTLSSGASSFVQSGCEGNLSTFAANHLRRISVSTRYFLPDELLAQLAERHNFPLVTMLHFDGDSFFWSALLKIANTYSDQLVELHLRSGLTSIEELDPAVFSKLTKLSTLNISGCQLEQLPGVIFSNNTQLRTLDASKNKLSALPGDIFVALTRLTYLSLAGNYMRVIRPDAFQHLPTLEELALGLPHMESSLDGIERDDLGNPLTELPAGLFRGLSRLHTLGLANAVLSRLPEGIFDPLPNLAVLWLDSNRLTVLPGGLFRAQRNLTQIWMSNNRLTELPPDLIAGHATMDEFFASNNNLKSIPSGLLAGLTRLRALSFTGNSIRRLPSGVLHDVTQLLRLWLGGNGLRLGTAERQDAGFARLTLLQVLHIGSNSVGQLEAGAFSHMPDLVFL